MGHCLIAAWLPDEVVTRAGRLIFEKGHPQAWPFSFTGLRRIPLRDNGKEFGARVARRTFKNRAISIASAKANSTLRICGP
jgi:hypothetical protein